MMMFKKAFEKLELDAVAVILDAVNDHLDGGAFDPVETTIMAIDVPFYPGYKFLDITDASLSPARKRYALVKSEKGSVITHVVVLDWTNEPIYILNQQAPIQLTPDNIAEYVRFSSPMCAANTGVLSSPKMSRTLTGKKTRRPKRVKPLQKCCFLSP